MDGGCGDTRAEVHPTLVEELAVHMVGDVDPGAFFTPLLYKVVTKIEVYLVCSDKAVDVGLVQPVLISEQNIDVCVVISEPVLVLTTCTAEEIQGSGLDRVPQLALAVLRGGVLVDDWEVGQSVGQFVTEMEMVSRHI
ncbi:unnamed protein product [Schistocephalus solidus]|uniref:Uncharacterized protein n=1 Tax=Schistocephalus solidus TaxID=70667 RepID=A0A183T7W8_SCHSO|nr:unnamed protein product [Schistocephalus solidus]